MSTSIAAIFTPGINKFAGLRSRQYAPLYRRLFKVVSMSGRQYMIQDMQLYGPPQVTLPLNPVHMDEVRQSFSKALTPITRTLGDIVSKEDWDDDPYGVLKRVIPARAGAMAESYQEKREEDCFYTFLSVTAYSTASPVSGSPDGKSLFHASHPVSLYNNGDTFSNVSSNPVALSNTAYYSAYATMRTQKMPNNYTYINSKPKYLLYNPTQRAVAVQIARGDFERASGTQAYQGLMNAAKEDALVLIETPHFRKTLSTSAANSYDGWQLYGEDHGLIFGSRSEMESNADYDANRRGYFWVSESRYDLGHWTARNSYSSAN